MSTTPPVDDTMAELVAVLRSIDGRLARIEALADRAEQAGHRITPLVTAYLVKLAQHPKVRKLLA